MAKIVPHEARLLVLIITLAITIPFLITVHNLNSNIRLLEAMIRGDPNAVYCTFEYVPASALVAPSQVAQWNHFVALMFGDAVLCSWSENAVICQAGNVTIPYNPMIHHDQWEE
jgi:hypothetical protein